MKIKKITLALSVAALGCGGIAAGAANQYLKDSRVTAEREFLNKFPTAPFLVSRMPLVAGQEITPDHFEIQRKFVNGIHADALKPGDEELIVGMRAKSDLTPGAPILKSQLTLDDLSGLASKVEDDEGVVTIAVNPLSSQSGMLSPEDRVDVLFTTVVNGQSSTNTFLTGMRVIATGQRLSSTLPADVQAYACLLYTSPSPRDLSTSRMPSSA